MIYSSVLLFLALLCFIVYHSIILPIYERRIFALYKCRDKLALYGMSDISKQESYEYKYLMTLLNSEIFLMHDNISFTQYFKNSVETPVEHEKQLEELFQRIQKDEVYSEVFYESSKIFGKYFDNKMKWFVRLILGPVGHILSFFIYVLEGTTKRRVQSGIERMEAYASGVPVVYKKYVKMNTLL